ncbi:MAG: type II toxin-antitoxin system VapC family toxin [Sphingomicrobium sp.]
MGDPFFDTNIVIDWLKRNPLATAELGLYDRHHISRIVWTEVLAGEEGGARELVLQALSHFEIVELDARIATAAAAIRFQSRMKLMDAFILATARVNGGTLITRNTKDFAAEMPGIRVPYNL